MVIKKVAVITGTRADYGYLKPLIEKIYKDKELYLQLFVTGMHLVREHGYSLKEVERDFPITEVVDIGFEAKSTNLDMAIWTGKGIEKFSKIFKKYEPDIVFVLGDRIEAFSIAASAYLLNIPVAHIAGGELTFNTVDDDLRHAITKLSHLHFVSTETYKKRVLQLGEEEWRVYNVGALSLENIEKIQIVSKKEIYKKYNFESNYPLILILYHPLTKDKKFLFEFENIINALEEFSDKYNKLNVLAIYPNTDSGGYLIVESLKKLKRKKNLNLRTIPNLSHEEYISILANSNVLIGNTSSGIIEAPSLGVPYICVGDRQKGRVRAKNTLDVKGDKKEILNALKKALFDTKFIDMVKKRENPYYQPKPSEKIIKIIKSISSKEKLLKKKFVDIVW